MEILIEAEAGEIIGADGDLFEAGSRNDTGHSAQPEQRVLCPQRDGCEIDTGSIANNAIDGSAHCLASAVPVPGRAASPIIDQLCRRSNYLVPKDLGEDPNFLANVIEDLRLDAVAHSVG